MWLQIPTQAVEILGIMHRHEHGHPGEQRHARGRAVIFVAEIYAAIDPEGTETRILFGTDSWHTGTGGSPANTPVYGRLLQPANFERSIASGKMIFGLTEAGYGECVVANADGAFDYLTTYGVSGRDFRLWACEPTTSAFTFEAFPNFSSWVQIFHATMQSIVGDGTVLRVRLRERVWKMKQKVCPPFLGTGGVEGVAAPPLYAEVAPPWSLKDVPA
jgi:hypothetical protein